MKIHLTAIIQGRGIQTLACRPDPELWCVLVLKSPTKHGLEPILGLVCAVVAMKKVYFSGTLTPAQSSSGLCSGLITPGPSERCGCPSNLL